MTQILPPSACDGCGAVITNVQAFYCGQKIENGVIWNVWHPLGTLICWNCGATIIECLGKPEQTIAQETASIPIEEVGLFSVRSFE